MINLFPKVKCEHCKKKMQREHTYELKYKSADGEDVIKLCKECASILVNMKKEMEDLYGDNNDNTI